MVRQRRTRATWRGLAVASGLITVAMGLTALTGMAAADAQAPAGLERGQEIYGQRCATCHGERGLGQGEVPGVAGQGRAAIDFYISTGRMPLKDEKERVVHRDQILTDAEKFALMDYIPTLATGPVGPDVPSVTGWESADIARGLELFTSNCAACHGPTAAGIAVGQDDISSTLDVATPLEIAEAIRVGPGVMPVFGEDVVPQEDLESIVAWVMDLRQRAAPGGAQIGRSGPVTEGFVAWILGMGLLTAVMYLLGERAEDSDDA